MLVGVLTSSGQSGLWLWWTKDVVINSVCPGVTELQTDMCMGAFSWSLLWSWIKCYCNVSSRGQRAATDTFSNQEEFNVGFCMFKFCFGLNITHCFFVFCQIKCLSALLKTHTQNKLHQMKILGHTGGTHMFQDMNEFYIFCNSCHFWWLFLRPSVKKYIHSFGVFHCLYQKSSCIFSVRLWWNFGTKQLANIRWAIIMLSSKSEDVNCT